MRSIVRILVWTLLTITIWPAIAPAEVNLIGAGATFPFPLYSKWIAEYQRLHPGVRINYQAIGSGGGIKQITERTVDFGATDGPMSEEQLKKVSGEILHVPMALGAVVPVYNLSDGASLRFSGQVLADIYLGKITKWNDPALAKLNPDARLPDQEITVVHRSDGSGTTFIFTDYLSKVSSQWKDGPGKSTSVKWPAGIGAKGNEGVTGVVKQTPGALGYVELIYALSNNLPFGEVENASGKAVKASIGSVTAAAGSMKEVPDDLRLSITNAPGEDAYPISGMTWLLVYKEQSDQAKGAALTSYLWWATHEGQSFCSELHYAPLPAEIVRRAEDKIKSIAAGGKPLLADTKGR